jgi:hypothetical protein
MQRRVSHVATPNPDEVKQRTSRAEEIPARDKEKTGYATWVNLTVANPNKVGSSKTDHVVCRTG